MSKKLSIKSYKGEYQVEFTENPFSILESLDPDLHHLVIDEKVYKLYEKELAPICEKISNIKIVACEENKSLERMHLYVDELVKHSIRRNHFLVAIGGGILQDITCFLASTLFRGMGWKFFPTTLLAQADSCIGSKSSLNVGSTKNLMGTFYPPREIYISTKFLDTLTDSEIKSGVGEMLKVHVIKGKNAFEKISTDYEKILNDSGTMNEYIYQSLLIKQEIIEVDEFDKNIRNVMNYGHSFGHAIEAATHYGIPHGLAVTVGMDLANFFSWKTGRLDQADFERMHPVLSKNYDGQQSHSIPWNVFFEAISKDKKNVGNQLKLILPTGNEAKVEKLGVEKSEEFKTICTEFFQTHGFEVQG